MTPFDWSPDGRQGGLMPHFKVGSLGFQPLVELHPAEGFSVRSHPRSPEGIQRFSNLNQNLRLALGAQVTQKLGTDGSISIKGAKISSGISVGAELKLGGRLIISINGSGPIRNHYPENFRTGIQKSF